MEELQGDEPDTSNLEEALSGLDFSRKTAGSLFVLSAFSHAVSTPQLALFFDSMGVFLLDFDAEQIKGDEDVFSAVVWRLVEAATECKRELEAVHLLLKAIPKVQPRARCLTPLHAPVLQLCILGRCQHLGARLLDEDPVHEVSADIGLESEDILKYFFYGGYVLTGLMRFREAVGLFQLCVTMPSQGEVSAISLSAYKKMLLVNLLAGGERSALPKNVHPNVQEALRSRTRPYMEIANAFCPSGASIRDVDLKLAEHRQILENDSNLGIARQLPSALRRKRLLNLSRAYTTLPVAKAAGLLELTRPEDVQTLVAEMVSDGALSDGTRIDEARQVLTFCSGEKHGYGIGSVQAMESAMQRIAGVAERIQALDSKMDLDPKYLQQRSRNERFGSSSRWANAELEPGSVGESTADMAQFYDDSHGMDAMLG
eukprot:scaffold172_cov254-Pinguiococcus_pyrenoidosus.AAC.14